MNDFNKNNQPMSEGKYTHHFTRTFSSVKPGDSGGIVSTYNGKIVGLECWSGINPETKKSSNTSGGVKIMRVLELVHAYKQVCENALSQK